MSIVNCKYCNTEINVPPSKVWRTSYCSADCRNNKKNDVINSRTKKCLCCGVSFVARKYQIDTGNAKYCSVACRNTAALPHLLSDESKIKSKKTYAKNLENGLIKHLSGELHPRWMGGSNETVKRRIKDGRANESLKKYRLNNKDKVREWSSTRLSRKTGRLPNGTVKAIGEKQKWLCVYCNLNILNKYHVDHIMPLSKGGEHIPQNLQLTCPSCNLKKSNKINYGVDKKL